MHKAMLQGETRAIGAHLVISLYSDLSWKIKAVRRKTSSRRDVGDN